MSGVDMSGALAALTGIVAIAGPEVVAVPPTTATCATLNEADKTTASENLLNIFHLQARQLARVHQMTQVRH